MPPSVLADLAGRLRLAGSVFAEDEAAALLAAGGSPEELAVMVDRRVAGEPLEQVLGHAEFCGLRVAVEPGVFVPRRRTELLVREALVGLAPSAVVVDLCCGSGALGMAVATRRPDVELHATDIDPVAIACAAGNLAVVRGRVHAGDLTAALPPNLRGRVDLLLVNAPYVPTSAIGLMPPEARLHEPTLALDGGPDGTAIQRRVIDEAPAWLAPGGRLLLECAGAQAPDLVGLAVAAGLDAGVVRDADLDGTLLHAVRR